MIVWVVFGGTGQAQEPSDRVIAEVRVRQQVAVSEGTILAKVRSRPGMVLSQELLNSDLKRLYETGYFADVRVDTSTEDGRVVVTFLVEEKPIVEGLHFEGARAFKEATLAEALGLTIGGFLDRSRLKDGIEVVRTRYDDRGYHLVATEYDVVVDRATNRAQVYVLVHEGGRFRIDQIVVTGNQGLAAKAVRKVMKTTPDGWFTSGFFHRDVMEEDLERIRERFRRAGYADADVVYGLEYDEPRARMTVRLVVTEGRFYEVGVVTLAGSLVIPEPELRARLAMVRGRPYSEAALREDLDALRRQYGERGYMRALVDATTTWNEQTERIDVAYRIAENERVYLDRIRIRGNTKTQDKVIRRELRIYPGDPVDGEKIRQSTQRLQDLRYFEQVTFDLVPGSAPTRQDLLVDVQEAKTGELSFGGGYSSVDQFVGFAEIAQRNFDLLNFPAMTGAGQTFRVRGQVGSVSNQLEMSFLEPWMFDRPVSFGLDVYRRSLEREGDVGTSYDEVRQGASTTVGRAFGEHYRADLTYTLERVDISDVPSDASVDLQAEEGRTTTSGVGLGLTRSTTDSSRDPTQGTILGLSAGLLGGPVGGETDLYKLAARVAQYVPLTPWHHVLELKVRAAVVEEYGDTDRVPIFERYFAGGTTTVRGFENRAVGPRDRASGDPIGGNTLVIGNLEYTFPIYRQILKGSVFCDVGDVHPDSYEFAFEDMKVGVGPGVRLVTPIGPVSLYVGFPFNEASGEDEPQFHFDISRGF